MKKHLNLLIVCWLVGLFLPICQSFLEPMSVKSVTDVLEHCTSDSTPQIVKFLVLFLCVVIGSCIARALSAIIRGKLSALRISDLTIDLMKKVLFTRNDYLLQNEPEKIVRRISRDTETATSYHISLWIDAPFALIGLVLSVWLMFFGSPEFLERDFNLSHQQGNVLLATVIVFHLCCAQHKNLRTAAETLGILRGDVICNLGDYSIRKRPDDFDLLIRVLKAAQNQEKLLVVARKIGDAYKILRFRLPSGSMGCQIVDLFTFKSEYKAIAKALEQAEEK